MREHSSYSLKELNTFGISALAHQFVEFDSIEEIKGWFDMNGTENPWMVLGGGSNILLTTDYKGAVLKNNIRGVEVIAKQGNHVHVKVGGGENWHSFVMKCMEENWGGLENLSLIPGSVGAAPIQNIGAYGVELKDSLVSVDVFFPETARLTSYSSMSCHLGYRDSIFKRDLKGKCIVTHVIFKLTTVEHYTKMEYGAIRAELEKMGKKGEEATIQDISDAVIAIRRSKLPDPAEIGNSGSFFKNPVVAKEKFDAILESYPTMPHYPVDENHIKLAAGWIIEQCGWKGYQGDKGEGVHDRQALVLVNRGNASGKAIYDLSQRILESVEEKFGITLEREVNVI